MPSLREATKRPRSDAGSAGFRPARDLPREEPKVETPKIEEAPKPRGRLHLCNEDGDSACGDLHGHRETRVIADHKAPHMCSACLSRHIASIHRFGVLVGGA